MSGFMHLEAGIHNVDAPTYHADLLRPDITLSSGLIRTLMNQSPRHAWERHPRLNPGYTSKDSDTFAFGRAAHRVILGAGGDFAVCPPDLLDARGYMTTKAAKEWEADARAKGLTPIKQDVLDKIEAMAEVMTRVLPEYGIKLDAKRSELTALGQVEGVWCRAMVDNAPADPAWPLFDFKTCVSADPASARASVMNYGYDVQAQFYLDAWQAATGQKRDFWFIMQEKEPPFEVAVISLSALDLSVAKERCTRARAQWSDCLRSNVWPGYPRKVLTLELPEYFHLKNQDIDAARMDAADDAA